ncbi:MAG TPA: thiamine phosphate synthase [Acetobacteraceae bacterium]|nr:thiamine phosphate synthase [Acetobacteraceae bacterium]
MDNRLIRDARAVKRRRRMPFPALWLFTDSIRMPDPLPVIAKLPRDIGGVVFRHDNIPNRVELARQVAGLCRIRGLPLVIAGDVRLAARLRAGQHRREGWMPRLRPRRGLITASAHGMAGLRRAARLGADLVFLSPAFPTASHPDAAALGALRWAQLSRSSRIPVLALGGIEGIRLRRLGSCCAGGGAIGALYTCIHKKQLVASMAQCGEIAVLSQFRDCVDYL